jgi:hypothetical protein
MNRDTTWNIRSADDGITGATKRGSCSTAWTNAYRQPAIPDDRRTEWGSRLPCSLNNPSITARSAAATCVSASV